MDPAGALSRATDRPLRCRRAKNPFRQVPLLTQLREARACRIRSDNPGWLVARDLGQNGAVRPTIAKLLCRLYDPRRHHRGWTRLRSRPGPWRLALACDRGIQDCHPLELSLRDNVAPAGAPDGVIQQATCGGWRSGLATSIPYLRGGYAGGTDLSGASGSVLPCTSFAPYGSAPVSCC